MFRKTGRFKLKQFNYSLLASMCDRNLELKILLFNKKHKWKFGRVKNEKCEI